MESPVKKLDLGVANKENDPDVATLAQEIDAKHAATKEAVNTENTLVKIPDLRSDELEEPILKENPHRFVLFPIQYHEVRDASIPQSNALSGPTLTQRYNRSGKCTRSTRHPSGLLRRSTFLRTYTTGTTV